MIDLRGKVNSESNNSEFRPPRVRVVGMGGAGIAAVDQIVLRGHEELDLLVVDTDEQPLLASVAEHRLLCGELQVHGLGCRGDADRARLVSEEDFELLNKTIEGCDYLLIAVGLGGGSGGGMLPTLLRLAQQERIQVVVLASLPFECEGPICQAQALRQLDEIRSISDCVMVCSLERMLLTGAVKERFRLGYEIMHECFARSIIALAKLIAQPGLLPLSFADVRSLFGRLQGIGVPENCWIGYTEGLLDLKNEELIEDLLAAPLMTGDDVWRQADRALVSIEGGRELSILEVQELMQQLQSRLPRPLPLAVSAHFSNQSEGKVKVTMLLARTLDSDKPIHSTPLITQPVVPVELPVKAPEIEVMEVLKEVQTQSRKKSVRSASEPVLAVKEMVMDEGTEPFFKNSRSKQEELPLEAPSRGRFEKSSETIYKGENLDTPTFRRRRVAIRL